MNLISRLCFASFLVLGLMVALGGCDKKRRPVHRYDGYHRGYPRYRYDHRDRRRPPAHRKPAYRRHDHHRDRHDRDDNRYYRDDRRHRHDHRSRRDHD